MATLGAKPNHAFFHCQHPARKKIPLHTSTTLLTNRRSTRSPRSDNAYSAHPPIDAKKKNIFFPAVLFAVCGARRVSAPAGGTGSDAHPAQVPASERSAFVISSKGRFSVSRKPDCAKVRELFDAFRGIGEVRRTCRRRTGNVDSDSFGRTPRPEFASRPLPEADRGGRAPPRAPRRSTQRKKPLADEASGLGKTGTRIERRRRAGSRISGRRLPAVRRSRPARVDR